MRFVRVVQGYDHLWAVFDEKKGADELTALFRKWSDANYLLDFFIENLRDLKSFFQIEKVSDAISDTMEDAQDLERLILDVGQFATQTPHPLQCCMSISIAPLYAILFYF